MCSMNITVEKILKGVVTLAIVAAVLFAVSFLWKVVLYVLVAAVLAIIGRPLVARISRTRVFGRNVPRSVAAALTLFVMWIVAGALCALLIPLVVDKVNELAALDWDGVMVAVETSLQSVKQFLENTFSLQVDDVGETFKNFVLSMVDGNVVSTFASVASLLVSIAIAFFSISFITFYFLKEDGLFYHLVTLFFPDRYRQNVHRALDSVTELLSRYFGGLIAESLTLMVIIWLVMWIFGMSSGDALIVGLIMGVMNVVPYAGPVIGCGISLCLAILTPMHGDVVYTISVLVTTVVVVKLIDDFIIQPTLYSKRVHAHPLEVFLVILIAGYIGGVWGMLLAIPLYTVGRVFAKEFFSQYSLVRKLTRQMTE